MSILRYSARRYAEVMLLEKTEDELVKIIEEFMPLIIENYDLKAQDNLLDDFYKLIYKSRDNTPLINWDGISKPLSKNQKDYYIAIKQICYFVFVAETIFLDRPILPIIIKDAPKNTHARMRYDWLNVFSDWAGNYTEDVIYIVYQDEDDDDTKPHRVSDI